MTYDGEIRPMRALLESMLIFPAFLAITSARPGDGKTLVAAALARTFAAAGRQTLALDVASHDGATSVLGAEINGIPSVSDPDAIVGGAVRSVGRLDLARIDPRAREDISYTAARAFVSAARERYEIVVADLETVATSASALLFAGRADGVLLTIRMGRAMIAADREVTAQLDQAGAKVLGIVPVGSRATYDASLWPQGVLEAKHDTAPLVWPAATTEPRTVA